MVPASGFVQEFFHPCVCFSRFSSEPFTEALLKAVKSPRSILKKSALMAFGDLFEFSATKVELNDKIVSAATHALLYKFLLVSDICHASGSTVVPLEVCSSSCNLRCSCFLSCHAVTVTPHSRMPRQQICLRRSRAYPGEDGSSLSSKQSSEHPASLSDSKQAPRNQGESNNVHPQYIHRHGEILADVDSTPLAIQPRFS